MILTIKQVAVIPNQFFTEKYEVKNGRRLLALIYKKTSPSTDSKGRLGAYQIEINKTYAVFNSSLELAKNDVLDFAVGYYQNENISIQ